MKEEEDSQNIHNCLIWQGLGDRPVLPFMPVHAFRGPLTGGLRVLQPVSTFHSLFPACECRLVDENVPF